MTLKEIANSLKRIGPVEKLLWLYVALVPLMKVPKLWLLAEKIQYADILFIFLFFIWLLRLFKKSQRLTPAPLIFSLALMLTTFLFSFINSNKWPVSAIEFLGILYLVCLYFLLIQLVNSEGIWWRIITFWVMLSCFLSTIAILAYVLKMHGAPSSFLLEEFKIFTQVDSRLVYRLTSFFCHPGMFAAYLHSSIVFAFILLARIKKPQISNIWVFFSLFFCMIAALLTKTRVNAGIAITVFLILASLRHKKNRIITILKYASFLYAFILIAFVFFTTVWWIFPIKVSINDEKKIISIDLNLIHQSYFIQHKVAYRMIKDHPFFGVGMGMYNYESIKYVNWEEAKNPYKMMYPNLTEKDENLYKKGIDPHSTYLGWAAETGLLGLLGILFFFSRFIYIIYRQFRTNSNNRYIYQCFLAGLVGFLFNGWFIDILTMRHLWFLMGIAIAFKRIDENRNIV